MENKNKLIFVIIIYGMLFLPSIIYPLVKNKMDLTNYENRTLSNLDDVVNADFVDFSTKFDEYYKDNLPFKNELQKLRAGIKYNIFKTPTSPKVIVGKNDWLFFNSGTDGLTDEVGDYNKTTRFSDEEYKLIEKNLESVNKKVNKLKANFHLLIPNNKSSVYREYMSSLYKVDETTDQNKTEALIEKLNKDTNINIIYPKEQLIANKNIAPTYYRYDTHWNLFGGLIGSLELMKTVENKDYNINDYHIKYKKNTKEDLLIMNQTKSLSNELEPYVVEVEDIECDESEDVIECYNENAQFDKTIMLIGDSFRIAMVKSLSSIYKHVIIVYVPYFKSEYLTKYGKLDDVVYEVVERNTYQLFTIDNFF